MIETRLSATASQERAVSDICFCHKEPLNPESHHSFIPFIHSIDWLIDWLIDRLINWLSVLGQVHSLFQSEFSI